MTHAVVNLDSEANAVVMCCSDDRAVVMCCSDSDPYIRCSENPTLYSERVEDHQKMVDTHDAMCYNITPLLYSIRERGIPVLLSSEL